MSGVAIDIAVCAIQTLAVLRQILGMELVKRLELLSGKYDGPLLFFIIIISSQ